jgi:hypothetical protein
MPRRASFKMGSLFPALLDIYEERRAKARHVARRKHTVPMAIETMHIERQVSCSQITRTPLHQPPAKP